MNTILYLLRYQVSISMGIFLLTVSVLTTTAICVDRLLALLLGLRYHQIVTFRRVRLVLISFWSLSSVVIGLRYSTGYVQTARSMLIALMLLSLLVSLVSYANLSPSPTSTTASTDPCATTTTSTTKWRSNFTEHSTIQEDGF